MAKQRVYELARDLGLESKEVLARAQELGVEVKTASSGLDEDAAALVRLSFDETAEDSPVPPGPEPKATSRRSLNRGPRRSHRRRRNRRRNRRKSQSPMMSMCSWSNPVSRHTSSLV